jgi:hypothetical protein
MKHQTKQGRSQKIVKKKSWVRIKKSHIPYSWRQTMPTAPNGANDAKQHQNSANSIK